MRARNRVSGGKCPELENPVPTLHLSQMSLFWNRSNLMIAQSLMERWQLWCNGHELSIHELGHSGLYDGWLNLIIYIVHTTCVAFYCLLKVCYYLVSIGKISVYKERHMSKAVGNAFNISHILFLLFWNLHKFHGLKITYKRYLPVLEVTRLTGFTKLKRRWWKSWVPFWKCWVEFVSLPFSASGICSHCGTSKRKLSQNRCNYVKCY